MRIFNIHQHDFVETLKILVFKECAVPQVLNGDGPESWPRSELVTQKALLSHRPMGMAQMAPRFVSYFVALHSVFQILQCVDFVGEVPGFKVLVLHFGHVGTVGSFLFAVTILFHIKALVMHQFLVANAKAEIEVCSFRLKRFL